MNQNIYMLTGGSHLYGLNNMDSDVDVRYVYLNTELSTIIGFDRLDVNNVCNDSEDNLGLELRKFLFLLRKGNVHCIEYLYAPSCTFVDPEFKKAILDQPDRLINSDNFFKAIDGYAKDEYDKVMGIRTSHMGKRKAALEKYGYSNRNATHLLRLLWAATRFFRTGKYPVVVKDHSHDMHTLLMQIKEHPETYSKERIDDLYSRFVKWYHIAYAETEVKYNYDNEYAMDVILKLYYPVLARKYWQL